MRLYTLHPQFLDRPGILGQWREGIQAKNALLDPNHSSNVCHARQLHRFQRSPKSRFSDTRLARISVFLHAVADEMILRGYHPNVSLIPYFEGDTQDIPRILVTQGQVEFEIQHLQKKLEKRDPDRLPKLASIRSLMFNQLNPIFKEIGGDIEPWEKQ